MAAMEDRWLSMKEICKYLGVSDDTVYKWINNYDMPAHRLGRLWKFKKEQVDSWAEAGGASSAQDNPPACAQCAGKEDENTTDPFKD